jgi:2'-5' RNA ligase
MNRYILAFPIPQSVTDELNQLYFSVTRQNIPVHFLHTSYLSPFWLKSSSSPKTILQTINTLKFPPFTAQAVSFAVFKQATRILHLTLTPKHSFQMIRDLLLEKISDQIKFDRGIFLNKKLPDYKPHITLDYDWHLEESLLDSLNQNAGRFKFPVDTINLYSEQKKWLWNQIN